MNPLRQRTPTQANAASLASFHLELVRQRLIEAGEPALALAAGGLQSKLGLTFGYTIAQATPGGVTP